MPQIGFQCCDGVCRSFGQCVAHAEESFCQWTPALLLAMAGDRDERSYLSVTELLGCPRKAVWSRQRTFYDTPDNMWLKWRGTAFHRALQLEDLNGTSIAEQRFFRELPNGVVISGQPDLIYPAQYLLLDYKSTKRVPTKPYEGHTLQVNAYRWLVEQEIPILNLEIVYLDMTQVRRIPVELLENKPMLDILCNKAEQIQDGLDGFDVDPVGESGRWQCPYCPFRNECWG